MATVSDIKTPARDRESTHDCGGDSTKCRGALPATHHSSRPGHAARAGGSFPSLGQAPTKSLGTVRISSPFRYRYKLFHGSSWSFFASGQDEISGKDFTKGFTN